jgi:hypothetical protein
MISAWDSDGYVSESEVTFSDKYWDPKPKDRRPTIIETGPMAFFIDDRHPVVSRKKRALSASRVSSQ